MMDCLLAKCIPCITDCVMAELEKLGGKYRLALRLAKDPRFERLPCTHSGTYADDCLLQRCQQHRCYIVATCDRDLKRKIRKVVFILDWSMGRYFLFRYRGYQLCLSIAEGIVLSECLKLSVLQKLKGAGGW